MTSQNKLNIFVSTLESRTGDAIAEELCANDQFKKLISSVKGTCGPSYQNDVLEKELGVKMTPLDVGQADVSKLADLMKGCSTAVLVPPASSDKVIIAQKLCDAAKKAGVENAILLSVLGADENKESLRQFKQIEDDFKSKGISNWCILRVGFLYQNLFLYAAQMKQTGSLGLPTGTGSFAPIDVRDVAVAVSQIATAKGGKTIESQHQGQVYTLTSDESVNGEKIVEIAKSQGGLGDIVKGFADISREDAEDLVSLIPGMDDSEVNLLLEQYDMVKNNKWNFVSNDYEKITGKKPTKLGEFFKESADIWKNPETAMKFQEPGKATMTGETSATIE